MKNPLAIVGLATALSELGFATSYGDLNSPPLPYCETEPFFNCECYVPIYQQVGGCDVFVSVDALYWFARERNLYYAIQGTQLPVGEVFQYPPLSSIITTSPSFTSLDQDCKSLGTRWSPGVRVGIGWGSDCNDWDLGVNWTYFYNQKTSRCSVPPFGHFDGAQWVFYPGVEESAISSLWVNQAALFFSNFQTELNYTFFQDVKANWRLTLNDLVLSIGRTLRLRNNFTFRPYAGIRGGWTKTEFQIRSLLQGNMTIPNNGQTNVDLVTKDRFIDRLWGVGLHLGIEPNWNFCPNWSVFGNFDAALIYGKSRSKKKENYQGSVSGSPQGGVPFLYGTALLEDYNAVAFTGSFFSMQPIFDLALGLRFERSFCSDRYHSQIDLAWEHHIWLENNYRVSMGEMNYIDIGRSTPSVRDIVAFPSSRDGISTTLDYGGPIFRLRLDF